MIARYSGKFNEHAMGSFVLFPPSPDVSRSPICEVGGSRSGDD